MRRRGPQPTVTFRARLVLPALGAAMIAGAAPAGLSHRPQPALQPAAAPSPVARADAPATLFRVVLDPSVQATPYTGRVYVAIAKGSTGEPRRRMGDWFAGTQILAMDAADAAPGSPVSITTGALSWPAAGGAIEPGTYRVQAVARRNPDSPQPGAGAGDLYSDAATVTLGPGAEPATLTLSHAVPERTFRQSDTVKLVSMVSPSLSQFHGRDVTISAGVVLPEGWKDDPSAHYPTLYWIGGFGGTHHDAAQAGRFISPPAGAPPTIIVIPDPSCHFGHSVFADSANNGPRGKALVDELIPEVEKRYHGAASADRRFVSGISSGGWSSLWLQVAYPDTFGGVWSHCPDPVDFRDFQQINLYAPGANMYRDAEGKKRPLARNGGEVMLWYEDFVRQEEVLGDGGQIRSFEAVFSPRGSDGRPVPLFDRQTGAVNTETARAWEKYDIRLVLERAWPAAGPRLAGKIHVYAGGLDTFYLEGAAAKLRESLSALGSDATVEIVPGAPHTVLPKGVQDMWRAIAEKCN